MDPDRKTRCEEMGRIEEADIIIRIYYLRKVLFSIRVKKGRNEICKITIINRKQNVQCNYPF